MKNSNQPDKPSPSLEEEIENLAKERYPGNEIINKDLRAGFICGFTTALLNPSPVDCNGDDWGVSDNALSNDIGDAPLKDINSIEQWADKLDYMTHIKCPECGSEKLEYVDAYACGDHWKCKECGKESCFVLSIVPNVQASVVEDADDWRQWADIVTGLKGLSTLGAKAMYLKENAIKLFKGSQNIAKKGEE